MSESRCTMPRGEILAAVAAAQEKIGNRFDVGEDPRFIAFHAAFSVCSEKVRTMLNVVGLPYVSHQVDVAACYDQNYSPQYVTLRKVAWEQAGCPPLAGEGNFEWTGSSSVAANGLDLCVVPTLVDLKPNGKDDDTPKVVVDSEVIVHYLAAAGSKERLIPEGLKEETARNLRFVDDMPHVAFLYDGNGVKESRPPYFAMLAKAGMLHGNQIDALERLLAERAYGDDPVLERAYRAKLAKTLAGHKLSEEAAKGKGSDYLQGVMDKAKGILREIEEIVAKSTTGWILNTEEPTLADYMHAVSFHRLTWIGNAFMYDDFPKVKDYNEKLMELKEVQDAVIFYPNMLPSYSTSPYFAKYKGKLAAFLNDRRVEEMTAMLWLATKVRSITAK